jgi:hypothetical protein
MVSSLAGKGFKSYDYYSTLFLKLSATYADSLLHISFTSFVILAFTSNIQGIIIIFNSYSSFAGVLPHRHHTSIIPCTLHHTQMSHVTPGLDLFIGD